MALPEKRRCGVPAGRFKIWGFCRFPLPCFAAGCRAFGFKIATAALRPRNDTKLGRLYLGNGRFSFMRPFRAILLRTVFIKRFALKPFRFPANPIRIVIARSDSDAAIFLCGLSARCCSAPFFKRFVSENRFVREAARRMQLPGEKIRSRTKKIGCPEKK